MKHLIFLLFTFAFCSSVNAQNITKIEYYIDTDPGYGLATDVPITSATPINNLNVSVPMGSIADGFHQFFARAKDATGAWSMVSSHQFLKVTPTNPPAAAIPNITKIEYYIDTDPGFGLATDVPITAGTPISNLNINLLMTSISDGFHQFFARAKDANGEWSMVSNHQFLKVTPTNPPATTIPNIVKVEYYINTDPGFGLATDVPITASTSINNLSINLPMTSLADGFYQFFARAKDANGVWSMVASHQFLKTTVTITPPASVPNIVKAEYFIDTDPGFESGVNIPLTAGTPINNLSATINLTSLALGTHKVYIRTKDANGAWSMVNIQTISVESNAMILGNVPSDFCRNSPFNISFVAGGTFNAGNVFTAQLSNASGSFSSPTVIGTLSGTSSGTIVATIPNSVTVANSYKVRVISSNPALPNVDEDTFNVLAICQCLNNISLMTGNWGTAGIWSCGHIPLTTEPVQISTGHTITLDVNGTAKSLDLRGILNKQATKVLLIQGN